MSMRNIPKLKKHNQTYATLTTADMENTRIFSKFGGKRGGKEKEGEDLVESNEGILERVREISYVHYDFEEACLFLLHWSDPSPGFFFFLYFFFLIFSYLFIFFFLVFLLIFYFSAPSDPSVRSHPDLMNSMLLAIDSLQVERERERERAKNPKLICFSRTVSTNLRALKDGLDASTALILFPPLLQCLLYPLPPSLSKKLSKIT